MSLGGATEATIWSNVFRVGAVQPQWRSIPYGKPIWNARYYVLDASLEPCPIGADGELYIGGQVLADGYAKHPMLTAQKSCPIPYSRYGARIYRTGDLARYGADGNLELLGRADFQVKVRGFRIRARRNRARARPAPVRSAAPGRGAGGGRGRQATGRVRHHAGRRAAPAVRAPAASAENPAGLHGPLRVRAAGALSESSNGKLDRQALPAPAKARPELETAFVAPRASWSPGLRRCGRRRWTWRRSASRTATSSSAAIRSPRWSSPARAAAGPRPHPPAALREADDCGARARLLADAGEKASTELPETPGEVAAAETYPLTPIQSGMLSLALSSEHRSYYTQQMGWDLHGALDVPRFAAAWESSVQRQPALRSSFEWSNVTGVRQRVQRAIDAPLEKLDWSERPAPEQQRLRTELMERDWARGFDLARAPLFRAYLIALGPSRHELLFFCHHLVLDGWSAALVLEDALVAYAGSEPGARPSFESFVRWHQGRAEAADRGFWRERLENVDGATPLPHDLGRAGAVTLDDELAFELSAELSERLRGFSRAHGITRDRS